METIVAKSWSHLCDVLFDRSWQSELGRYRSHYAFKGLSNLEYELTTTLQRLNVGNPAVERHLLRNFRKYGTKDAEPGGTFWNWLALAQHHGLPTRLLDWTYSPLVALHFATDSAPLADQDSQVVAIDYVRAHTLLPRKLRKTLEEEGGDVWTGEMLNEAIPDWTALDKLTGPEGPLLLFFEPPAIDQRIVNQYALFSLLTDSGQDLEGWIANHEDLAYRVVIPHPLRQEVRDKLDQANINERTLFPGLDGLCRWLRRHYGPQRATEPLIERQEGGGEPVDSLP